MNTFMEWISQLRFDWLVDSLALVLAAVLSITVHETCHGLAAWWLGDPTAKMAGRLTLNPLKHIDLMGLVLLAVAKFGWAKPVPVDARYFRNPKAGMAVTALAGPLSNLLLALAALLVRSLVIFGVLQLGESAILEFLLTFLAYIAIISSGLAVFNLFPIPPMDGSKILFSILPEKLWLQLMRYERFGMLLVAALLLTGVMDTPLNVLRNGLLDVLETIGLQPLYGLMKLFP